MVELTKRFPHCPHFTMAYSTFKKIYKNSFLGIARTPKLAKISDEDPEGPGGGSERREEQKPAKPVDTDKTDQKAIFKILYDGEIFIIKKAGDGRRPKENIFNDPNYTKPSKPFLDSVNRTIKTKSDLTKDLMKEEPSVNKTLKRHSSTELSTPRYREQTKLIAKVEQFLTKSSSTNVDKQEGTKQYKSAKKLKKYDQQKIDFLNYFFPLKVVLQEAFLKAKKGTIYDKDAPSKSREIWKSQKISISDKPKRWKSLFWDLGTDPIQRIKDDFFECKHLRV